VTRTKAFLSYSHVDREWRERLVTHLAVLQRKGLLELWNDTQIRAGDRWGKQIDAELSQCRVAILLISPNFLASTFIQTVEVQALLERHESDGLLLTPLIARPCAWTLVDWLARLQCRPDGGRALSVDNEASIDTQLAMFTYEISALLGEFESGVVDNMAQLVDSASRQRDGTAAELPAHPAISDLELDRSWDGTYRAVGGGSDRPMRLTIESQSGDRLSGRIDWPSQGATTIIDGEISDVPITEAQTRSYWKDVADRGTSPQMFLRFTEIRQVRGDALQLNGDYRAALEPGGILSGLWYSNVESTRPIGEFALNSL
jgi:hypothetical protein